MKYCINCGEAIKEINNFCEGCGQKVSSKLTEGSKEVVEQGHKKTTALSPLKVVGWIIIVGMLGFGMLAIFQ